MLSYLSNMEFSKKLLILVDFFENLFSEVMWFTWRTKYFQFAKLGASLNIYNDDIKLISFAVSTENKWIHLDSIVLRRPRIVWHLND